jgi:hypothetical protein
MINFKYFKASFIIPIVISCFAGSGQSSQRWGGGWETGNVDPLPRQATAARGWGSLFLLMDWLRSGMNQDNPKFWRAASVIVSSLRNGLPDTPDKEFCSNILEEASETIYRALQLSERSGKDTEDKRSSENTFQAATEAVRAVATLLRRKGLRGPWE